MDRADISRIAHRRHPIAAPVPDDAVDRLLAGLLPPGGGDVVVDLGCGRGEWLRRLVRARPTTVATGVDVVAHDRFDDLDELDAAIQWQTGDAALWGQGPVDAVVIVGAGHVFGGFDGVLATVRRLVRPGGRALVGDGFWESAPPESVLAQLGYNDAEQLPALSGMVRTIASAGFEIIDAHVSTTRDWDDYEWSWAGSLIESAMTDADAVHRQQLLEIAAEHRRSWLEGYRGILGFASFLLVEGAAASDAWSHRG